ncbi:cytochrome P450 [Aspergillus pseudoustus]|uniref:Cytochrome P450 n=1 Tax=Aspergillus pseudoustus TaxID=1810923 RepID=A0ABR4KEF7_9EURO
MIAEIFTLRGGAYLSIAGLAIWLVRLQLNSRRDARKAQQLGCKETPSYPDGLNAFGLPILYEFYKADQACEVEQVTIRQLEHLSKKLGREVATYRISVLGSENIVTADEENIHAVLVSQFNDFTLGPYRCGGFRPLLGEGIFAADGAKWAHSRALLKPQFTRSQMNDLDLEDRHISHLLDSIPSPDKDGWTSHPDFRALFHHYTLDSAMEMLLGVTPGTTGFSTGMADEVDWERLTECVDLSLSMIATRLLLGPFYWIYSTPAFRRCRDEVFAFVDRCVTSALEVAKTKNELQEKPSTAPETPSRYVLLDALAEHTSDPIELREQMLNVLLAGRDTTAAFLSYLVILLARHPRVYAKLRAEVLAKFGDGAATTAGAEKEAGGEGEGGGRDTTTPITFDSLRACTYLQHVLHETARLYPLVPATKRFAARDTTLPRGGGPDGLSPIFVTAGTEVMYHTHALHRSVRIWGADAHDYVPERWTGRKLSGRCEYIPFSAGPRVCMGQQLALMKAGYFAVRFVQRFEGVDDVNATAFGGRIRCQVALGNSPADPVKLRLRIAKN